MNIATLLDMSAEAFGDRVAVVSGDTRLTYAELKAAAQAAAQPLQLLARRAKGRRVALRWARSRSARAAEEGRRGAAPDRFRRCTNRSAVLLRGDFSVRWAEGPPRDRGRPAGPGRPRKILHALPPRCG